jgi:hypothetical protein
VGPCRGSNSQRMRGRGRSMTTGGYHGREGTFPIGGDVRTWRELAREIVLAGPEGAGKHPGHILLCLASWHSGMSPAEGESSPRSIADEQRIEPCQPGRDCGSAMIATRRQPKERCRPNIASHAHVGLPTGSSGDHGFPGTLLLRRRASQKSAPFLLFASNSRKTFALLLISNLFGLVVYRPP